MPVTVIVGGQKGDEGKGKLAAYLALKKDFDICVRISGPNAGHTINYRGKSFGLATIPCGYINERSRILIGRGAFIDIPRMLAEIESTGLKGSGRLGIDKYATVITDRHKDKERSDRHLMDEIGSVGTGLGTARIEKIKRDSCTVFAKDIPEIEPYIADTTEEIFAALGQDKKVLVEGDQGFGLSLIHGEFPFVTSRDTSASTFLGEVGIGPTAVEDVYIVFKPYVTRVAPGPLKNEEKNVSEWYHTAGGEVGTVSGRKRRIGEFEWDNARKAVQINGATRICITHMDVFGNIKDGEFSHQAKSFLEDIKKELSSVYPFPVISLLSYGPGVEHVLEYEK
ncbi:MAG: adenylosuccinate synthetase [Elusimicrobia bacterium]|nr:adenylosuccinate synthetase [Elusimicrobiota bacterium]